jgi:hypothetical protein
LVAVAIVVVVALVAAGVGWTFLRDDDDDTAAPEPTTTTETTPESTTPTTDDEQAPSEDEAELEAIVEELQDYVEDERGLEFKQDVVVELLDGDEFEARLLEDFEEDREELEQDALLMQALGVLEPGADLADALEDVLTAGVLGFYDPETDELVVRGADVNLFVQQTIVHELVHALDDQWYDLDRPELDDAADETGFGFGVLVEGSARYFDQGWTDSLPSEDQEALERQAREFEADMLGSIDPTSFPFEIYDFIASQYPLGASFVDAIIEEDGDGAVDAAFEAPPATSKEVMEPDAYLDGFEPTPVEPPSAEGTVVDEGVFGQFLLEFVLDREPSIDAEEVASGWAGDWYVAWEADGQTCLRADFAAEDESAGARLAESLTEWATSLPDAEVEELSSGLVRLTSCVEGTAGGARSAG